VLAGVALISHDWTLVALAAFVGLAFVARGTLHLLGPLAFVGLAGAFAILEVVGDIGVGIAAMVWPHPTLLSLSLLVGIWAVVRAVTRATIAITTRAEHPLWLVIVAATAIAACLGVLLIVRSGASLHDVSVTIGLLMVLEGTRELSEAAFRRREPRPTRQMPTRSVAAAS
jgi:uncharacterized membrane protein HdeD (DUF308 family)